MRDFHGILCRNVFCLPTAIVSLTLLGGFASLALSQDQQGPDARVRIIFAGDVMLAWLTEPDVLADIKAAREVHHADLVIPFLHWGNEMEPAPDESQKTLPAS